LPDLSRLDLKNQAVYGSELLPNPLTLIANAGYGLLGIGIGNRYPHSRAVSFNTLLGRRWRQNSMFLNLNSGMKRFWCIVGKTGTAAWSKIGPCPLQTHDEQYSQ